MWCSIFLQLSIHCTVLIYVDWQGNFAQPDLPVGNWSVTQTVQLIAILKYWRLTAHNPVSLKLKLQDIMVERILRDEFNGTIINNVHKFCFMSSSYYFFVTKINYFYFLSEKCTSKKFHQNRYSTYTVKSKTKKLDCRMYDSDRQMKKTKL